MSLPRSSLMFLMLVPAALVTSARPADAQTVNEVFAFSATHLAAGPVGTPVQGRDGKLYGVVNGSIFRISPGGKNAQIIYAGNSTSGWSAISLILATDGKFYGTGYGGGSGGKGILFSLTPDGRLTVLYQFTGGSDGANPATPLLEAADGNLYGTTITGNNYQGTVYKYETSTGLFSTILSFNPDGSQGNTLDNGPLIQASDGNLYGTAVSGGAYDYGTIFSLTTSGTLLWLYSFGGAYPIQPDGALMQASDGNIYGTTGGGGIGTAYCPSGCGTIFMLANEQVSFLYSFQGYPFDGQYPTAALLEGSDGQLYGTTEYGGNDSDGSKDYGVLYRITTDPFQYQLLYSFIQRIGWSPYWAMMQHTSGRFFGMTAAGGRYGEGAMYSLNMSLSPFVALVRYTGRIGQPVQILGQGLTGTTSVTINGVPATSFKVMSDTFMTAIVPVGATTGPVVATTPSGTLTSNRNFQIVH